MTSQTQQLQILRKQNDRLVQQIAIQQTQYKKLHDKYQKSLKQLALIVKANQTIKHDYDDLESQMNKIIKQKTQQNERKLKQYIRKQLDQLNHTIENLNQDKQKLIIEKNSLSIRVNSLTLQKNKTQAQRQQISKKYEILKSQLSNMDPQTKDHQKNKSMQQIKKNYQIVDQLGDEIKILRKQKQQIETQYIIKIQQIQTLWQKWHQYEHQINLNKDNGHKNQIKLKLNGAINGLSINQNGLSINQNADKTKIINVQRKSHSQNMNIQHNQMNKQIQTMNRRLRLLQNQNSTLKQYIQNLKQSQKIINDLKLINAKLVQQKMTVQDKYQNVVIQKAINASRINNTHMEGSSKQKQHKNNDEDLISILKDLHQQLSPLRRQITVLKRQQSQKYINTSSDRANFQVKIIKLQKQLQFYKDHNHMLKKQLIDYKSQKQLIHELQKKSQQLEQQKNILQGRVIVMESLNVTDRTRVDSDTYNSLRQFQRRIQLLIQDPNILKDLEGNHLQQLIAMKAYILELDQRLKQIGIQNQKLLKKYNYSKQKIYHLNIQLKQVQNRQMTKILMYKQKMQAYDKLVEKLTLQLQKNIAKKQLSQQKNSRLSSQLQFNQVVNLYEEKMINMGQQIVRIRRDKQSLQTQIRQLHLQVNKKIRELNDKQRDIVMLKTENINTQNLKNNLQKSVLQLRIQNQFYKQNKQYKGQSLQKSRFISILEQENYQIRSKYQQQTEKLRQLYENEIMSLRKGIYQLQTKLNEISYEKRKLQQAGQSSKKLQTIIQKQKSDKSIPGSQILQKQIQQKGKIIKQLQNRLQLQSVNFSKQLQRFKISQDQKINRIKLLEQQLSNQLSTTQKQKYLNQIHQLNLLIQQKTFLVQQKNNELRQLQQVIIKNNHEISLLRNETNRNNYYKIQNQHMRTQSTNQFIEENARLHNQLYEKNIKLSGLESSIFNLKLQNQRVKNQYHLIEQKLSILQSELKIKSSKIFSLENQARKSSNHHDSSIMAKQSLIRSYENQINNLKLRIQDLQNLKKEQTQKRQSRIKQLQKQINTRSVAESYIYNQQNKFSPNSSPQRASQIQTYKIQIKELSEQLNQKLRLTNQLTVKIQSLQAKIKVYLSQMELKSQTILKLQKQMMSYQKSNSYISQSIQDELESLNTQVLALRANIITLKDQIQFKQSKNSELKHEIYVLKLQNKRLQKFQLQSKRNLLKSNQFQISPQNNVIQTKQQQKNSANQINQLQQQITRLQCLNDQLEDQIVHLTQQKQQLLYKQSNQLQKIHQLNEDLIKMTQNIKRFQSNESNLNNQTIEELQRLRRLQNNMDSQRCKVLVLELNRKQLLIQQLRKQHQIQLRSINVQIKAIQNELQAKNIQINQILNSTQMNVHNHQENYFENNHYRVPSTNHRPQIQSQQASKLSENLNSQQNIDYLLNQIQRLNIVTKNYQIQLEELKVQVSKYQNQQQRYKQNLALIMLLSIEIQSLRNRLSDKQSFNRKQIEEMLEKLKIKKLVSVDGVVDFDILKELQSSHQDLVNYITSLQSNHKKQYSNIGQIKQNQVISYPSQSLVSHNSINNIDSSYSIQNPFKKYYRHAQSSYNPLSLSPRSPIYEKKPQTNNNPVILGSFGKISQSHNIDSSYGSQKSALQTSNYVPHQSGGYSYTLKNVNMISSVGGITDENRNKSKQKIQSVSSINYGIQKSNYDLQKPSYKQQQSYMISSASSNSMSYPYSSYVGSSSVNYPSLASNYNYNTNLNTTATPSVGYTAYNNSTLASTDNYATSYDYSKLFKQPTYGYNLNNL